MHRSNYSAYPYVLDTFVVGPVRVVRYFQEHGKGSVNGLRCGDHIGEKVEDRGICSSLQESISDETRGPLQTVTDPCKTNSVEPP